MMAWMEVKSTGLRRLVVLAMLSLGVMAVPAQAQLLDTLAGTNELIKAMRDNDHEAFQKALLGDVQPTIRNGSGVPAIILAVESKDIYFVNGLIEAGARPDDRPRKRDDQRTALTRAAELGQAGMVKALLEAGADPDLPGTQNEPALIKAASLGHIPVIQMLIDGSADLNASDVTGRTAIEIAERASHFAVADLLRNAGAD